jgi:hypothetical protein
MEQEAWKRLKRYIELQNALWREHDTGRQERELDLKLVDTAMEQYAALRR